VVGILIARVLVHAGVVAKESVVDMHAVGNWTSTHDGFPNKLVDGPWIRMSVWTYRYEVANVQLEVVLFH